ncbi:hypothetical protein M0804_001857 [Polistes exclamans]|nr:hypothetical protein M0804_001857 [Polistes exclamans]
MGDRTFRRGKLTESEFEFESESESGAQRNNVPFNKVALITRHARQIDVSREGLWGPSFASQLVWPPAREATPLTLTVENHKCPSLSLSLSPSPSPNLKVKEEEEEEEEEDTEENFERRPQERERVDDGLVRHNGYEKKGMRRREFGEVVGAGSGGAGGGGNRCDPPPPSLVDQYHQRDD